MTQGTRPESQAQQEISQENGTKVTRAKESFDRRLYQAIEAMYFNWGEEDVDTFLSTLDDILKEYGINAKFVDEAIGDHPQPQGNQGVQPENPQEADHPVSEFPQPPDVLYLNKHLVEDWIHASFNEEPDLEESFKYIRADILYEWLSKPDVKHAFDLLFEKAGKLVVTPKCFISDEEIEILRKQYKNSNLIDSALSGRVL